MIKITLAIFLSVHSLSISSFPVFAEGEETVIDVTDTEQTEEIETEQVVETEPPVEETPVVEEIVEDNNVNNQEVIEEETKREEIIEEEPITETVQENETEQPTEEVNTEEVNKVEEEAIKQEEVVVEEPQQTEEPIIEEETPIEEVTVIGEENPIEEEIIEETEEEKEVEEVLVPFDESQTIDGVVINVKAEAGTFPEGATLSVQKVSRRDQAKVEEAIENERSEATNVVESFTFDIKVLDKDGNEIQPSEGKEVKVSFAHEKVQDTELSTNVYHIKEEGNNLTVKPLDVETEGDTATVTTDSFSYYTVEFTYNDKQYVLDGGKTVKLEDVLKTLGIEGEVKGVTVSAPNLFNVVMGKEDGPRYIYTFAPTDGIGYAGSDEDNLGKVYAPYIAVNDPEGTIRYIASYQPFTSEEWMDVLMEDGTTHHIIVTDAIMGDGTDVNIPGLYQGENLTNFAPLIPVADVWIDASKFYTPSDESKVNGDWDVFIPGELMDPTSSKYNAAFKEDYPANEGTSVGSNKKGRHFVYYDSTVDALDGYISTTRTSDGETIYQSYNYFEGTLCTYKWENAAVRLKDDGTEEYLDVYIEYSNPLITIQPLLDNQMNNVSQGQTNAANVTDPSQLVSLDNYYVGLVGGNVVATGAKTPTGAGLVQRYGLQIGAKPYIKDKNGNIIDVKMYFPMTDLDVSRSTNGKFSGFYQGNPLLDNYDPTSDNYSEGVRVKDGLVINSSGDRLYIPGSEGGYQAVVSSENGGYAVGAHGSDNATFNSGFLALVQNGQFNLTIKSSGGNTYGSLFTVVMSGGEYNYRLRHSTETLKPDGTSESDGTKGGTIQTTREGNHNGELNDGQIINPSMIASAVGQTIVYTFTPQPGYALNALYVWNDPNKTDPTFPTTTDMKSLTKLKEGDGTNNTYEAFDDDGDGVIDRYTYTFEAIHSDNAIHVVWVQTALDIRKSVIGSGSTDDTFTFTIKAWGDSNSDGTDEFVDFTDSSTMGSLASRFTSIENGLYQFTLDSYETISIPPGVIPFDFEYEVEEIEVSGKYGTLEGWTPVGATVQSGKLTTDDPFGKVTFTNKRKKDTNPDETLTIKKVWEEDASNIRPKNITIYLQRDVVGIDGATFRTALHNAYGGQNAMQNQLTAFKWGTSAQAEAASSKVTVANTYGDTPVYVWKEGAELYLYSDADIYFTGTIANLFASCTQLNNISALEHVHTDYVISLYRTFYDCRSLTDLSPLAGWNTASVNNIQQTFRGTSRMALSDLSPLSDWDTRNVTNMQQIFYYTSVQDLSDIAGWDVSRVTTFNQAFAYTMAAQAEQTAIANGWDPGLCTNFGNMFQYSNGGSTLVGNQYLNLPVFTARTGTWSTTGGSYSNVAPTHASQSPNDKPTDTQSQFFNDVYEIIHTRVHDVDESDPSGNTWVYEFEVPAETKWLLWESLPESYSPYYTLSKTTQTDDEGTTTDLGAGVGVEDNPAHGATAKSVTTLTNTRNKHELKIKKDSSPATNERFTFTLTLWAISESNKYDLPNNYPKLTDGSLTRVSAGTYEFTLIPPGTMELELPAGIRYSVTEAEQDGWSLISEHNTTGLLNREKEASFINAKNDALRVVKTWENDYDNNVWMNDRPLGADSLGITVITMDRSTRWRQTGTAILTDIVGTAEQQAAFYEVQALYEASAIIPELKASDGTTDIATYAPKRVRVETAVGTLLPVGDYVVDAVEGNTGQYIAYPVTNVPYEHTYTQPDSFLEDDGAGQWVYEYNISKGDDILSVEESTIPEYYQKIEESTNASGQIVYNITNSMDARDLVIEKKTVDNEPGLFEYGIKFYFDTDTSERHPVKVGHTQIIMDKDELGQDIYEYEIYFENGVTFSGKDVSGLNEIINEQVVSGKMTKTEMDSILAVMKNLAENADTMVNGVDSEFTRHHSTALNLADLGIQWNGQDSETIYVEQDSSVVKNMFTTGRRLDWFIIPTPGHDEVISVRTPYTLRRETQTKNGITYPKQIPNGVTGQDGTYYFTLRNGEKIVFNDLPVGVSYEIVEMRKVGWDLKEVVNASGKMNQKNDNSGTVEEIWLYKGTEYNTHAAAVTVALSDITEGTDTGTGNKIYTNNAVYSNKNDAIEAAIIKNHDNTWAYSGTNYSTYENAYDAVVTEVNNGKNNDNTYAYSGATYYTRKAVENMALADIEEYDDDGVTKYRYTDANGDIHTSDDYSSIEQIARGDVVETGSDDTHAYTYQGTAYPSLVAAQYSAKAAIIDNQDGTYTYEGTTYNSYQDAETAALATIVDKQNSTYTYKGVTYASASEAEAAGLLNISANDDNTYIVNRQSYATYGAAKTAAEALVGTIGTGSSATYTLVATYDNQYDAEKAAKLAITKKPFEAREAIFTNEREKGTIKVVKETVSNDDGTFKFRMMTGRVVKAEDVKDQDGNVLPITRIYPTGDSAETLNITNIERHSTYTEYTTSSSDVYKMTDEIVAGQEVRKAYLNNVEIPTFNIVYPQEFTDLNGINYKFVTTTTTENDQTITTTTLNIETTIFEFELENGEYATIANIPNGSRDRIWEVSDNEGNLVEVGWELVSIDGDTKNTEFKVDGITYEGIDAVMQTDEVVTHTFLNDRTKIPLKIEKVVTGNQGSRDKYFKFKIEIENAGERTLHLDMSNATKTFDGSLSNKPNSATIYTKDTILNGSGSEGGNNRDDDLATLTYGSANDIQRIECEWSDGTYLYQYDKDGGSWIKKEEATGTEVEPSEPPDTAMRTGKHGQHILTGKQGEADYGKATIYVYLQNGESATIRDLPFGAKYTVTEVQEDYKSITSINDEGDKKTGEVRQNDSTISNGTDILLGINRNPVTDTFFQKDTTLTFTNTRDGVVPTEIFFDGDSWLLLLMIPVAYYGYYRRKRRKRGDAYG